MYEEIFLVDVFHPILLTWFLVVFGDEVMKIVRNSLFIFHFVLPVLPRGNGKHHTENYATEVTKNPKRKLPKYVSQANI